MPPPHTAACSHIVLVMASRSRAPAGKMPTGCGSRGSASPFIPYAASARGPASRPAARRETAQETSHLPAPLDRLLVGDLDAIAAQVDAVWEQMRGWEALASE